MELLTEEKALRKVMEQLQCVEDVAQAVCEILVDFYDWKFTKANITKSFNLYKHFQKRNNLDFTN